MLKNYIYLIRRREHVRLDEPIYKIGHTTRGIERLKEYDSGLGIEIHAMLPVLDSSEAEKRLINVFDSKYTSAYSTTGSKESYKGDVDEMIKDIRKVAKGHSTVKEQCPLHVYKILDDVTINNVKYIAHKLDTYNKKELCNIRDYLGGHISMKKTKKDIIVYLMDIWPKLYITYPPLTIMGSIYYYHLLDTYDNSILKRIASDLYYHVDIRCKDSDLRTIIRNNWSYKYIKDITQYPNCIVH